MKRSKSVLIVCHCILNANAKVYPLATTGGVLHEAVSEYIASGCGILQLPCPELSYLGINRWGMTREQYDHPNFRENCRQILKQPLIQIQALTQAGYKLVGILGMDGSPNCGVSLTCEGYTGGEICSQGNLAGQIASLRYVPGRGIFMQELVELLRRVGLHPDLLAVKEKQALK